MMKTTKTTKTAKQRLVLPTAVAVVVVAGSAVWSCGAHVVVSADAGTGGGGAGGATATSNDTNVCAG